MFVVCYLFFRLFGSIVWKVACFEVGSRLPRKAPNSRDQWPHVRVQTTTTITAIFAKSAIYESVCTLLKHIRLTECRTFLDWSEGTEAIKLVACSAAILSFVCCMHGDVVLPSNEGDESHEGY